MKVRIEFDATAHFSFVIELTKKEFSDFQATGQNIFVNDESRQDFHKLLIDFVNQDIDTFDYIFHDTDIEELEISKEI